MCFPSLKTFTVLKGFFLLLACHPTALALLWQFLTTWLWERRMRSPIFLVSRVGSRSLYHIRLSKTDFDLILSNSNANSKSLKHELLLVSAVAGHNRPALHLVRELDQQHLKVYGVLMTSGGFFSAWFFSIYQVKYSGLLIVGFGLCPEGPPLQLWSALRAQLSRLCL